MSPLAVSNYREAVGITRPPPQGFEPSTRWRPLAVDRPKFSSPRAAMAEASEIFAFGLVGNRLFSSAPQLERTNEVPREKQNSRGSQTCSPLEQAAQKWRASSYCLFSCSRNLHHNREFSRNPD